MCGLREREAGALINWHPRAPPITLFVACILWRRTIVSDARQSCQTCNMKFNSESAGAFIQDSRAGGFAVKARFAADVGALPIRETSVPAVIKHLLLEYSTSRISALDEQRLGEHLQDAIMVCR